jgi:hypothetical protein
MEHLGPFLLNAMMNNAGLDISKVEILPSASDTVPLLLAGKVDAMAVSPMQNRRSAHYRRKRNHHPHGARLWCA